MNRRTFLQMAALAACGTAVSAASTLSAEVRAQVQGEAVTVLLTLRNPGVQDVDVLLDHGNRSAIEIQGRTGVWTLTPEPEERRTLMTRAAPRKVWFPVRAGGTLEAGSFRLTLPSPALASLPADASFLFTLQTGQGALELSADKVLLVAS